MDRIRSIIVGIDFTACSASALRQALRIAKWNRAKVHIVHVVDPQIADELESALSPTIADVRGSLLSEVKAESEPRALDVSVVGRRPPPSRGASDFQIRVDQLAEVPRANASELLKLASGILLTNEGGEGHGTGTVATGIVRHAPSKVLLVRDPHTGPFRNVVACVDFSDTSREALAQAARVAVQDEAFLHVIHVFEPPWRRMRGRSASIPPADSTSAEKAWRDALPVRLRDFAKPLESEMKYLKPEYEIIDRPGYGQAIADYSRDLAAPLVVLGTRGRTNLRDLMIGSTAERVVRDAPCSILAVKPD